MREHYLRKADIAAMFNMKWDRAASILKTHGVAPIDFGVGSGHGLRWLESAVNSVMRDLHTQAQTFPAANPESLSKNNFRKIQKKSIGITNKSNGEIFELVINHQIH